MQNPIKMDDLGVPLLGGGNSNIFGIFTPIPTWGFMIQFDERAYFSNGLVVQPPTTLR